MNDSNNNNNIFENNNVTPTLQENNEMTGTNSTINNINPIPTNTNSMHDTNPISPIQQANTLQGSQAEPLMHPQNNLNPQMNSTIPNSSINPIPTNSNSMLETNPISPIQQANTLPTSQTEPLIQPQNNLNPQMNNQIPNSNINQSQNNNIISQSNLINNQENDDELLRAFIGNNFEKITTRPFNFAGFFFTTFYMFYRKMFGYALLVFLLNIVIVNALNQYAITLLFNIVIGLLFNKIYLSYAKKKITMIKANNQQKTNEELKSICTSKGGTSVGKIFLGLLTELGIAVIISLLMMLIGLGGVFSELLKFENWNITVNDGNNTNDNSSTQTNGTLVEDVTVVGHTCINSKCTISIEDSNGNSTDYVLGINNSELINALGDYKDYIKLNIYYNKKGKENTIVNYKLFLKSNNEDISNVKDENELREKIGLYSIGTHTDTFTLTKIGMTGFGMNDDETYSYTSYTFTDSKNISYEMKYINSNVKLAEGNQYNVTFEVTKGTFEYEFIIKSIN